MSYALLIDGVEIASSQKSTHRETLNMSNKNDTVSYGYESDYEKYFDESRRAAEIGPLPAGEYLADIITGEVKIDHTTGNRLYRLTFAVVESSTFDGRRFCMDCWLTPAAKPQSLRDLTKIGITSLNQVEQPLSAIFRCKVRLAVRRDNSCEMRNRVQFFEVLEGSPLHPIPPAKGPDETPTV